jgi:hypothetical protein
MSSNRSIFIVALRGAWSETQVLGAWWKKLVLGQKHKCLVEKAGAWLNRSKKQAESQVLSAWLNRRRCQLSVNRRMNRRSETQVESHFLGAWSETKCFVLG